MVTTKLFWADCCSLVSCWGCAEWRSLVKVLRYDTTRALSNLQSSPSLGCFLRGVLCWRQVSGVQNKNLLIKKKKWWLQEGESSHQLSHSSPVNWQRKCLISPPFTLVWSLHVLRKSVLISVRINGADWQRSWKENAGNLAGKLYLIFWVLLGLGSYSYQCRGAFCNNTRVSGSNKQMLLLLMLARGK